MKRMIYATCIFLFLVLTVCGCAQRLEQHDTAEKILFTDSLGREVELPARITRIAPSGSVATMILATIAPEYMVSVSEDIDNVKGKYLSDFLDDLPAAGQLYGGKSSISPESLLACDAQIIIDLGDRKNGMAEELNALQEQVGIPVIFLEADLMHMEQMYRALGMILDGKKERGAELADFASQTLAMAKEKRALIAADESVRVMFTAGADGLGTNAKGSTQAQVIELVGAENAILVEDVINKGGGNLINLEQLYLFDPDVILFSPDSYYAAAADDAAWQQLTAVRNGEFYEIPDEPYNWMANPPSINMLLGVWWLGNLIYPQYYDYDMGEKAQEIFRTLWNYELSGEETAALLANSTLK